MSVVFLSPHPDDVVLSCGGEIWQLARQGVPLRVITIFAGDPDDEAAEMPFARHQHHLWGDPPRPMALRRAEDLAACVQLGLRPEDVVHLSFQDAVYRRTPEGVAMYPSDEALFGHVHPGDEGLDEQIAQALCPLIQEGARLVVPAGVGHHVDHLIVRRAAERLQLEGYEVAFYEELPYAEAPEAFAHRPSQGLIETFVVLHEADMAVKVRAALYYRTQLSLLFGGEMQLNERLRAHAAQHAPPGVPYVERRWVL